MMLRPLTLLVCAASGLLSANIQAETHAAHEHGVAELNLAQVESDILLEINSPAHNVFGFEHPPHSENEKTKVKQRIQQIKTEPLVTFNPEAQCQQQSALIDNPFHTQHEHEHEHEKSGHTHKDVHIEYTYRCQNPQSLSTLKLNGLFKRWPQLETVRAQWLLSDQQSGGTLSRQQPSISFK
jgi:hypothetical protein